MGLFGGPPSVRTWHSVHTAVPRFCAWDGEWHDTEWVRVDVPSPQPVPWRCKYCDETTRWVWLYMEHPWPMHIYDGWVARCEWEVGVRVGRRMVARRVGRHGVLGDVDQMRAAKAEQMRRADRLRARGMPAKRRSQFGNEPSF